MKILPINHERFREVCRVEINSVQRTFTEKLLCARHVAGDEGFKDLYDGISTFKELPVQQEKGHP